MYIFTKIKQRKKFYPVLIVRRWCPIQITSRDEIKILVYTTKTKRPKFQIMTGLNNNMPDACTHNQVIAKAMVITHFDFSIEKKIISTNILDNQ